MVQTNDIQDVKLRIIGIAEGSDSIEINTVATCIFSNDTTYITYDEHESGMSSTVSKIGISDSLVTLSRIGDYSSTMVFEQGRSSSSFMTTPMGLLEVSVFTNKLKTKINDNGVEVKLEYTLGIEGHDFANKLTVIATKTNNKISNS